MTKSRISLCVFCLVFSSLSSAAPTVDLIFTGTTGSGTTGTNTIRAEAGDELTLDIVVTNPDDAGICEARISLSWDAGILTGYGAQTCPSPPYATAGRCADHLGGGYTIVSDPTEFAGLAEGFHVFHYCRVSSLYGPGPFISQSLVLGRTKLLVNVDGTSDITLADNYSNTVCTRSNILGLRCIAFSPTAKATVRPPPPGGGC